MSKEQSGNPEMAFLRCGLVGAGLIAVCGAFGAWLMFVVSERLAREEAAGRLQGGWITSDGTELWFDFTDGDRGTLETWSPDAGESSTRVRVAWTGPGEVAVAVGRGANRESYLGLYFGGDPDTITMTDDSTGGPPMLLRRNKRPGSP